MSHYKNINQLAAKITRKNKGASKIKIGDAREVLKQLCELEAASKKESDSPALFILKRSLTLRAKIKR
jgi:hypothetical protein